jgi:hypothetical protein
MITYFVTTGWKERVTGSTGKNMRVRKDLLLRLDPAVYDALARWASDELRSTNAQIEFVLRQALAEAGRLPKSVGPLPRRGRPSRAQLMSEASASDVPLNPVEAEGGRGRHKQ